MATQLSEVLDSFHSSFMDKTELPESLELMWVKKAVAEYSIEIEPLNYDPDTGEFTGDLDQYIIDTLATMMKVYYLSRELSRVNKIASVVSKDLSINGTNGLQKYIKDEYASVQETLSEMLNNQKESAYN